MSPHDLALELLEKAASDEYAIDALLNDPAVDDAIIGFHCQQAAEKLLKAVLVEREQSFNKNHNLNYLVQLLSDSGDGLPPELSELDTLNPFAVTLRYETMNVILSFDRQKSRRLVRALRTWVVERVQLSGS
jgi:HEPN domain-containing protein